MAVNTNLVDYNDGVRQFSGEEEVYRKHLIDFTYNPLFDELSKAIKEQRFEDAYNRVHELKNSARNLSLMRLYHQLTPLEELLRDECNLKTASVVCNNLMETHDRTIYKIKQIIKKDT